MSAEPELDKGKNETSSRRDLQATGEACASGLVESGLVFPDGFAGRGRAQGAPTGKLAPAPELLEWRWPPRTCSLDQKSPAPFSCVLAPPLCTLTPFGKLQKGTLPARHFPGAENRDLGDLGETGLTRGLE